MATEAQKLEAIKMISSYEERKAVYQASIIKKMKDAGITDAEIEAVKKAA